MKKDFRLPECITRGSAPWVVIKQALSIGPILAVVILVSMAIATPGDLKKLTVSRFGLELISAYGYGIAGLLLVGSGSIIAHEFGHWAALRRFGISCLTVDVGRGEPLLTRKWKETVWTLHSGFGLGEASESTKEILQLSIRDQGKLYAVVSAMGPIAGMLYCSLVGGAAWYLMPKNLHHSMWSNGFYTYFICASGFVAIVQFCALLCFGKGHDGWHFFRGLWMWISGRSCE